MVDTAGLPHGRAEAEDRHSNFYNARVNLVERPPATEFEVLTVSGTRYTVGLVAHVCTDSEHP
jgi:hypothetical protein